MMKAEKQARPLESFTNHFAKVAGSARGFLIALITILLWLMAGFGYDFSNNWQNAIQIYIGILTFLMIFLIQRAQNKELTVLHVKLDEIILSSSQADNELVKAGNLTEKEISSVHDAHLKTVADQGTAK